MNYAPLDLASYFPFYLGTIANRWTTTSSRIYLDRFGIGIGEWRVLASIHSLGQASSLEVVNLIAMDASAVSRSLARLERDGHVSPVPGKFVGRTKPYTLTSSGHRLYADVHQIALARERTLLGALDPDEQRQLVALMGKVMSRIDDL